MNPHDRQPASRSGDSPLVRTLINMLAMKKRYCLLLLFSTLFSFFVPAITHSQDIEQIQIRINEPPPPGDYEEFYPGHHTFDITTAFGDVLYFELAATCNCPWELSLENAPSSIQVEGMDDFSGPNYFGMTFHVQPPAGGTFSFDLVSTNTSSGDEVGRQTINLTVTPPTPDANNILYVDTNVSGGNQSGDSWTNALPELADALQWAREQHEAGSGWSESDPLQIWVAEGTYTPLYKAAEQDNDGNPTTERDNAFVMIPNVQLYGGFDPGNGIEDVDDDRIRPSSDESGNGTILNGDLGTEGDNSDNAYHVVISAGDVGNALLEGVTITGGNADGDDASISVAGEDIHRQYGGGMYNGESSPQVTDVLLLENRGQVVAGGMYNVHSSPELHRVWFINNTAEENSGGGMRNSDSNPVLKNVLFTGNSAGTGGGAISNTQSFPILSNVTITGNSAGGRGGGLYNQAIFTSEATVANNTILWGNTADTEGYENVYNAGDSNTEFRYSFVKGAYDSEGEWNSSLGTDVEGNFNDHGLNLNANDLFRDPGNNDYSLVLTSPSVNAGNNQLYIDAGGDLANDMDLAGNSRLYDGDPADDVIDMGAYEFQGEPANVTFTKAFAGPAQPGNTVTLEFTIENHSAGTLTDLSFTDDLDATLPGLTATGLPQTDICGPGSELSGTSNLSLTGGTLSGNDSCTFSATLQVPVDAAPMDYTNTTSQLTGTMDGSAVAFDPAINTLTVEELSVTPDENNILYVDTNVSSGNGSGDSWANALPELADALQWAEDNWDGDTDGTLQIWVAEGVYHPVEPADPNNVTETERQATFQLVNHVEIYGGFDPDGGIVSLSDERILPSTGGTGGGTILSGDIDGNDSATIITDPENDIQGINSNHVVIGSDTDETALLNGVTITAGYAMGGGNDGSGGGLYIDGGSPALAHLAVSGNRAEVHGGGMRISGGGAPTMTYVTFTGNSAGSSGGGISNRGAPTLSNVDFTDNSAGDFGGGMDNLGNPILSNVTFTGNQANNGGGMRNIGNPTLTNATFTGNSADRNGGGISNDYGSTLTLTNSILWGNSAGSDGNEMYNRSGSSGDVTVTLSHSLYANGANDIENNDFGGGTITFNETASLHDDPEFADPENGDFTLQSTSPAVNTGDPATDMSLFPVNESGEPIDLAGQPRVVDDNIDLGAYEYQGSANQAPDFTSTPDSTAKEGTLYSYAIEATDPDGDALTLTAIQKPGWATFTDHEDGTATLEGTPGFDDSGDHEVALESLPARKHLPSPWPTATAPRILLPNR